MKQCTEKTKKPNDEKGKKGGRSSVNKDVEQITNEETGTGRDDLDDIPLYGPNDYKES